MLTLEDLSGAQAEDTAAETWPELTMSYKNLPARCKRPHYPIRTQFTPCSQRQLRYIEWKGVKIHDLQNVTFSILFKLYIARLGVLITKRYHMLG